MLLKYYVYLKYGKEVFGEDQYQLQAMFRNREDAEEYASKDENLVIEEPTEKDFGMPESP